MGLKTDLKIYLRQIAPIPLLTRNEELQYGKRIDAARTALHRASADIDKTRKALCELAKMEDAGSITAKRKIRQLKMHIKKITLQEKEWEKEFTDACNALVERNLRLVVSMALKYKHLGEVLNLIQIGNIGLMRAAEKFQWQRNVKFATYAMSWIRRDIWRESPKDSYAIGVPSYVLEKIPTIKKIQKQFVFGNGRLPTVEELIQRTGYKETHINRVLELIRKPQSLEDTFDEDDDDSTLLNKHVTESDSGMEEIVDTIRLVRCLHETMATALTPGQLAVLIGLFCEQKKVREIAKELQLSRPTIYVLKNDALDNIRTSGGAQLETLYKA